MNWKKLVTNAYPGRRRDGQVPEEPADNAEEVQIPQVSIVLILTRRTLVGSGKKHFHRFWIMLEKEFKDDPDKLVGIFKSLAFVFSKVLSLLLQIFFCR